MTKQNEKTISVRYYVNYDLKTRIIDGIEYSPVYVQVNYDGKNTKFKLELHDQPMYVETELGMKDSFFHNEKLTLANLEKQIKEIILFEVGKLKSKFRLKGIGSRLYFYNKRLDYFFEAFSKKHLEKYLEDKMIYKDYMKMATINDYQKRIEFVWSYFKNDFKNLFDANTQTDANEKMFGIIVFFLFFRKLTTDAVANNYSNPFKGMNYFKWIVQGGREEFIKFFKEIIPFMKKLDSYETHKELYDLLLQPEEFAKEIDVIGKTIMNFDTR